MRLIPALLITVTLAACSSKKAPPVPEEPPPRTYEVQVFGGTMDLCGGLHVVPIEDVVPEALLDGVTLPAQLAVDELVVIYLLPADSVITTTDLAITLPDYDMAVMDAQNLNGMGAHAFVTYVLAFTGCEEFQLVKPIPAPAPGPQPQPKLFPAPPAPQPELFPVPLPQPTADGAPIVLELAGIGTGILPDGGVR